MLLFLSLNCRSALDMSSKSGSKRPAAVNSESSNHTMVSDLPQERPNGRVCFVLSWRPWFSPPTLCGNVLLKQHAQVIWALIFFICKMGTALLTLHYEILKDKWQTQQIISDKKPKKQWLPLWSSIELLWEIDFISINNKYYPIWGGNITVGWFKSWMRNLISSRYCWIPTPISFSQPGLWSGICSPTTFGGWNTGFPWFECFIFLIWWAFSMC